MKLDLAPLRHALAAVLLAPLASATWSILIVDSATGEIAVAQATCIVGPNLQRRLAVVVPGVGGACVQAWWDDTGARRAMIWNDLHAGLTPDEIVAHLGTLPSPHLYQYGIVATHAPAATYTGSSAGGWAGGITGSDGTLAWAIQGNVLAGDEVVLAAEDAIRHTSGALPEKLMAAMLAAAEMGGDGRCSCSSGNPDGCGAPPPGFELTSGKSAHVGFMLVARLGDSLGVCDSTNGCANGDYFMSLDVVPGQPGLPDPIVEMHRQYAAWRASLVGRADAIESETTITPPVVPGNGASTAELVIRLADWQGAPITHGGALVTVEHAPESAGLATIGFVVDRGDGSYAVQLTAGVGQGTDVLHVRVDEGGGAILLAPLPRLEHGSTLVADATELSIASGGVVGLDLHGPPAATPRPYHLLGSLSGTEPGRSFGSIVLPLNPDRFFRYTWTNANGPVLHDTIGTLALDGTAHAELHSPPSFFAPSFLGRELAFAFLMTDALDFASSPARILLVP